MRKAVKMPLIKMFAELWGSENVTHYAEEVVLGQRPRRPHCLTPGRGVSAVARRRDPRRPHGGLATHARYAQVFNRPP